jgi:hypothetical protein
MNHEDLIKDAIELANSVESGESEALTGYIKLKLALSELGDLVDKIAPLAIQKRLTYGRENPIFHGFSVEYSEGTPRYSYKHSESWAKAQEQVKAIEEAMKQSAKLGQTIVDETTGEVFEPATISYSKPFLKLTNPK